MPMTLLVISLGVSSHGRTTGLPVHPWFFTFVSTNRWIMKIRLATAVSLLFPLVSTNRWIMKIRLATAVSLLFPLVIIAYVSSASPLVSSIFQKRDILDCSPVPESAPRLIALDCLAAINRMTHVGAQSWTQRVRFGISRDAMVRQRRFEWVHG